MKLLDLMVLINFFSDFEQTNDTCVIKFGAFVDVCFYFKGQRIKLMGSVVCG